MGQAAGPSLYDFCDGDPVNHTDPDGRCVDRVAAFFADPLGNEGEMAHLYDDLKVIDDFNRQDIPALAKDIAQNIAQYIEQNTGQVVPLAAYDFYVLELAAARKTQAEDVANMSFEQVCVEALKADGVFRYTTDRDGNVVYTATVTFDVGGIGKAPGGDINYILQGMVWASSKYGIGTGDLAITYWNGFDSWMPPLIRNWIIPQGGDIGPVQPHQFFPSKIPSAIWWANQGADFYNNNVSNNPPPLQIPVTL